MAALFLRLRVNDIREVSERLSNAEEVVRTYKVLQYYHKSVNSLQCIYFRSSDSSEFSHKLVMAKDSEPKGQIQHSKRNRVPRKAREKSAVNLNNLAVMMEIIDSSISVESTSKGKQILFED